MQKPLILKDIIKKIIERHLEAQKDYLPNNLYMEVIQEVEKPLIDVVLQHTKGNISHASKILGLSRATLRKKSNTNK